MNNTFGSSWRIEKIALIQMCRENINWSDLGLGTGYLKAFLDQQRPEVYDIRIFRSTDFQNTCARESFDFVGVSTVSHYYDSAVKLANWIRTNQIAPMVIIGGPHITCAPQSLAPCFDFGVVGEGEITFLELLDSLSAGLPYSQIATIGGLLSWQDGKPVLMARRPLLSDLDTLPLPDINIFKETGSIPSILLTRGCPFSCSFCISSAMWQSKVRRPSPDCTVNILKKLNEQMAGLKVMIIKDDIAFISSDYLRNIISRMEQTSPELLHIPKVVYSRADIFTPDFARALKDFGVYKTVFGFESGSDRILKILKGRKATVDQNQTAIDIAHEMGFVSAGHFIIGAPEETVDDLRLTYNFILRNLSAGKLPSPTTTVLTPFPGTRYWQTLLEREPGATLTAFRWDRLEENGFASYYSEMGGTVEEWWEYREANQKVYLGKVPKKEFLGIASAYEPEITMKHANFLLKDYKY